MNNHSITLPNFDIGFVKDFSKIIRLANYGFPSIVIRSLLHPQLCSPACTSPSIGLQFHPQAWARLAASPSTRLLLHSQSACCFICNPLATSPSIVSPACSNNYFCLSQTQIKPFEFFPLNSAQLNSCSTVQLFNCSTVQ